MQALPENVTSALSSIAPPLDEVIAEAAKRYYSRAALKPADLRSGTDQLSRLSGDGRTDYRQVAVPFEYALRYQGRQINAALSALSEAILEHDGPVRIVDLGAGTGAVEMATASLLHALRSCGALGTRRVEIVAYERSIWMASMGRLMLEELDRRLPVSHQTVAWVNSPHALPAGPAPQGSPTLLVGAHLLHPIAPADEWANPLNRIADHVDAQQLVFTSSRRSSDSDLIWGVQATLRRADGVGRGGWHLRNNPAELADALVDDPAGLPRTAAVAREVYGAENRPVPLWHRYPPLVYRLERILSRAGTAAA